MKPQLSPVAILDLAPGMVIYQHGGLFRIDQATVYLADDHPALHPHLRRGGVGDQLPTMAAQCTFIRDADQYGCSIPTHWRKDWVCQGNSRRGNVLVAEEG